MTSIYQSAPNGWRVTLRPTNDWVTAYGQGKTLRNALLRAWKQGRGIMSGQEWNRKRPRHKHNIYQDR